MPSTCLRVRYRDFDAERFSFHHCPILVLEEFWSAEDLAHWRQAMSAQTWTPLSALPQVARAFPGCGNWMKASMGQADASFLMQRISLPCIAQYIESFPGITRRHVSFSFYTYRAGDCLRTHDDTDEAYAPPGTVRPARRLALVTYLHPVWEPDWGGELLIYDQEGPVGAKPRLTLAHSVQPEPGSLVIFTVPRFHRVARVDPLAGTHARLSIAGWFMTEH
jgi:SM-20-related protein